ncbi:hypothetical protein Dalk_1326 [Desulfatibacillum aliphaticivorans]|uniref:Uncharacterized protein n=1 Tax=Desulfatibacillum aliphaticivorans TaxID=218208 RepID=B8F9T1_DESAL|nr:hypothetical protein [Desulfatibacillum aliphaticivorans]ACL03027.1 hypothetical protein Dalk_1326 [Desulfatibacillum aliphaticivorans]
MTDTGLKTIINHLGGWLTRHEVEVEGDGLSLMDPICKRVVGSHYALSHYFAGLLIAAHTEQDREMLGKAERIFDYICATHDEYVVKADYHNDFNNFIWAFLIKASERYKGLVTDNMKQKCQSFLLSVKDSNHWTTNWLPMRAFNNAVRYEITGQAAYMKQRDSLLEKVFGALGPDGLFEDSVDKGVSANPQYHVATVAVLLVGEAFECWALPRQEIDKSIAFFLAHISPEGDYNFYGRGTNQIFGWGPALFLLKNIQDEKELFNRCLTYVLRHLPSCLSKNGLLLENSTRKQQINWRYYHHASVYVGHFYFWSALSGLISTPLSNGSGNNISGGSVHLLSTKSSYALTFQGRKKYLQERGPMICGVWMDYYGCLFKGPLGSFFESPDWRKDHPAHSCVVENYMGVVAESHKVHFLRKLGRIGRRLGKKLPFYHVLMQEPFFPDELKSEAKGGDFEFTYRFRSKLPRGASFIVPVFSKLNLDHSKVNEIFSVLYQGECPELFRYGSVMGPYHEVDLFCAPVKSEVHEIVLRICCPEKGEVKKEA